VRQRGGVSAVVSEVRWGGQVKAMLLEDKSIAFEVQKGCFLLAKSMLLKTNLKVIVWQGDRERWAMDREECLER